jgi:hypothetical protein
MSRYGRSEHGSRSEHGEQVRARPAGHSMASRSEHDKWVRAIHASQGEPRLTYLFVKESRREREVRAKGEMRRGGLT